MYLSKVLSSVVLCWGAPGSPIVMAACSCWCWGKLRGWPSAEVPITNGNCGKRSEERTGLGEWLSEASLGWPWKATDWAWSWKSWLALGKPVWVAEAGCLPKWLPLMEGYAAPEAVLDWAMNGDVWLTRGFLCLGVMWPAPIEGNCCLRKVLAWRPC